jgi:hypothetical protein
MELNKNTHVMSTQRTTALKKAIQLAPREISTVRGRIFTEVFSRNEDKPLFVKIATNPDKGLRPTAQRFAPGTTTS